MNIVAEDTALFEGRAFRMPIAEIVMDRRSVAIVIKDIMAGKLSRSTGPVSLRTGTDGLELTDGYHRVLQALLTGKKAIQGTLDGLYATDYGIPHDKGWTVDLKDVDGSLSALGISPEDIGVARGQCEQPLSEAPIGNIDFMGGDEPASLRGVVTEGYTYISQPDGLVYHGSKTPLIKDFEYRKTKRYVLWTEVEKQANGFFFALSADEAREFGRHVGAYQIVCNHPLIHGTEGTDRVSPKKAEDLRYILMPMFDDNGDGSYTFDGLVHTFDVSQDEIDAENPEWIYNFIQTGGIDWECLDNPAVVQRMKERGYDGSVVYEPDVASKRSWFVISPQQITFVGDADQMGRDDDDEEFHW